MVRGKSVRIKRLHGKFEFYLQKYQTNKKEKQLFSVIGAIAGKVCESETEDTAVITPIGSVMRI